MSVQDAVGLQLSLSRLGMVEMRWFLPQPAWRGQLSDKDAKSWRRASIWGLGYGDAERGVRA